MPGTIACAELQPPLRAGYRTGAKRRPGDKSKARCRRSPGDDGQCQERLCVRWFSTFVRADYRISVQTRRDSFPSGSCFLVLLYSPFLFQQGCSTFSYRSQIESSQPSLRFRPSYYHTSQIRMPAIPPESSKLPSPPFHEILELPAATAHARMSHCRRLYPRSSARARTQNTHAHSHTHAHSQWFATLGPSLHSNNLTIHFCNVSWEDQWVNANPDDNIYNVTWEVRSGMYDIIERFSRCGECWTVEYCSDELSCEAVFL